MGTSQHTTRPRRTLAIVGWSGLAVLLVVAFFGTFVALNKTVYGAGAFVERYLAAIARDDLGAAVATPGVDLGPADLEARGLPADTSRAMLRAGVIDEHPENVQITADVAGDDGTHTVTASYTVGDSILSTEFRVRPIDALYGVLNRWAFEVSPLAVIEVNVQHGAVFQVGKLELDARAAKEGDELSAFDQSAPYLAIAPAGYDFRSDSTLLTAQQQRYTAEPGSTGAVTLDLQPTAAFAERVQQQVASYLADDCATQPVLQPAGCPFGAQIEDRVIGDPTWTIASTPTVVLTAGDGAFVMPPTQGVAHLSVLVRSLFDGSTEQQETDYPFTLALTARIQPDGGIEVQLQ